MLHYSVTIDLAWILRLRIQQRISQGSKMGGRKGRKQERRGREGAGSEREEGGKMQRKGPHLPWEISVCCCFVLFFWRGSGRGWTHVDCTRQFGIAGTWTTIASTEEGARLWHQAASAGAAEQGTLPLLTSSEGGV